MTRSKEAKKRRRQKRQSRKRKAELKISVQIQAYLTDKYPFLFGTVKVPLEIGIFQKIREENPDLPYSALQYFLRYWTTRLSYLRSLTEEGIRRRRLDGTVSDYVTDEGRKRAKEQILNIENSRQQYIRKNTEDPHQ